VFGQALSSPFLTRYAQAKPADRGADLDIPDRISRRCATLFERYKDELRRRSR